MADVKGTPTTGNDAAGTSTTITLPSNASGDLIVIGLKVMANPTASISGYTKDASDPTSNNAGLSIFTKVSGGSESNPLATWSGSRKSAWICYVVENHDGVSDAAVSNHASNASSHAAPSVDAVGADSLLLSFIGLLGTVTASNPTGMTDQELDGSSAPQNGTIISARETVGDGATGTRTWSSVSPSTRGQSGNIVIANLAGGATIDGAVSDVAGFQDSQTAELIAEASASEGIGLGDTVTASVVRNANVSETIGLDDSPSSGATIDASVSESMGLQDVASSVATLEASLSETLGLQDAVVDETPDLAPWEPPAGHVAYTWSEGAAWTDVDVTSIGVTAGTADIAGAIEAHIDANRPDRIRYVFPAGHYTLSTELRVNRDFKRLVGAGSDLTVINITGSGRIVFGGGDGSSSDIVGSPSRGDTTVEVLDASITEVGETIIIKQTADDTVTCVDDNTSPYSVGTIAVEGFAEDPWAQIVEVTDVNETTDIITFTPALALDYDSAKNPYAKDINNLFEVGVESLTINVTTDNGNNALEFDRCKQVRCYDVRVFDYAKFGITCRECFEVEISWCRLIGSRDQGTGGNGYGIHLELATTKAYVHDNAIAGLYRHAISLETGASHNIVAYNYVAVASSEDLTDLSIHGHYTHHNLIEGNIFHGVVEINDFYPETLQNVVFRNKILGNPNFWDADSRDYAFWVRRKSLVALVGNRCDTTSVARIFDCSTDSMVELNGSSDAPAAWMGDSRFLNAKPADWGASYVWPPFAGNASNTIPAEDLVLGTFVDAAVAETLGLLDLVSSGSSIDAAVAETLGLQDAQTRTAIFNVSVVESMGQTDSMGNAAELASNVAEELALEDTLLATRNLVASIVEAYGAGDDWAVALVQNVTMATESIGLQDLITAVIDSPGNLSGFISETFGIQDTVAGILDAHGLASDDLGLSDTMVATLLAVGQMSEAIGFGGTFTATLEAVITGQVAEALGLVDNLTAQLLTVGAVSEAVGMGSDTVASMNLQASIAESIGFGGSWSATAIYQANISEEIGLQDVVSFPREAGYALGVVIVTARALGDVSVSQRSSGDVSTNPST